MSLGEFQENMHVGESLPVAGGTGADGELSAAVTSCNSAQLFRTTDAEPGAGLASFNQPESMKNGRVISRGFHRRAGF